VTAALALTFTGLGSQSAFAIDGKIPPFGNVSYSTFI
jgi:hypothetical protein